MCYTACTSFVQCYQPKDVVQRKMESQAKTDVWIQRNRDVILPLSCSLRWIQIYPVWIGAIPQSDGVKRHGVTAK